MSNYFKQLDKEKARQQNVGQQEYILTNHTDLIGFRGRKFDIHAEALRKATTFSNLSRLPSVEYEDPADFWDNWETNVVVQGLEELIVSS